MSNEEYAKLIWLWEWSGRNNKVFQKTVYFLQETGMTTNKFHFGYYPFGPYSQSLSQQLNHALSLRGFYNPQKTELPEVIKDIRPFVKSRGYWYELLSRIHFLMNIVYGSEKSKERCLEKLQPKFPREDFEVAWNILEKRKMVKNES